LSVEEILVNEVENNQNFGG